MAENHIQEKIHCHFVTEGTIGDGKHSL